MSENVRMTLELPRGLQDRFLALSMIREKGKRVSMSEHVRRAMFEYANRIEKLIREKRTTHEKQGGEI